MYLKIYLKPTFMDLAPDCLCPVEVAASYFRVSENCLHGAPSPRSKSATNRLTDVAQAACMTSDGNK